MSQARNGEPGPAAMDRERDSFGYFHSITTRWKDNDVYGHVNNVEYYSYIDTTSNEYLIRHGVLDPERGQAIGLVVESMCQFFSPLSHPDVLECGLRVAHLGRSSVRYEVGIFSAGEVDAAAVGYQIHVFVDRHTRKPTAIPDDMREAMQKLVRHSLLKELK